jgi:hypothetical protein
MASFSRQLLSGSTNGKPIPVAATATPGTLLHTVAAGTGGNDEIDLWAHNTTSSAIVLTVEWGGVTDPGDLLCKGLSVAANSTARIAEGQVMNNGLSIRAFAGGAGLNITGRVLRIS